MATKKCPSCRSFVDSSWRFCPVCGEELYEDFFDEIVNELNERIKRMTEINQSFEAFDATPMFSSAGGFSIKITKNGESEKPIVEIRTFGNVKPEEIEKSLIAKGIPIHSKVIPTKAITKQKNSPKSFSEPQTKITTEGDKVIIEMNLPEITSLKDIEISKLENSIEVRAYGKNQGYFKIIAVPPEARIIGKSFSGGVLRLELEKK